MTVLVIGVVVAWVVIAVLVFLVYELMRHSGRLLIRVEGLESRVSELSETRDGLSAKAHRLNTAPEAKAPEPARGNLESPRPGLGNIVRESKIARDGLAVGTPAPQFRLPRVGGGEVGLDEYKGQSVLLVFSDPGCGPCNALAPKLERLHRQSLDLEVLMVSRGSPADNEGKIAEHGLTFPVVLQKHWEISRLYAMFATPIAYLLDEHLTVTAEVAMGVDAIVTLAMRRRAPSAVA